MTFPPSFPSLLRIQFRFFMRGDDPPRRAGVKRRAKYQGKDLQRWPEGVRCGYARIAEQNSMRGLHRGIEQVFV